MVQTLYMDGPKFHPSPGTLPHPEADESAPSVGCSVEVPYRTKRLQVSKGELFEFEPPNENFTDRLFLEACHALPVRLMGVVFPEVRDQYTLSLNHHRLGRVELDWRAKRPKRVDGKGRVRFTLFSRECKVSSDVPGVSSETFYEQVCAFRGSIPKGINPEIPEFFQPEKRIFRMEIAWATDRHGRPTAVKGTRRYPIGYSGTADSALSRLGVHFSGPYRSDGERHGVAGQDPLNAHIDDACREGLVDIMACYLLPRHGARVMELYVSQNQPSDDSTLDMLRRSIEKKAIPLQPRSRSSRPRRRPAAGKEYHRKTTGPHQMWATDASYFRVVGWGYYYLVTVMDDYSRFILAWRLQRDMTSDSFIEVVQEAVDRTGMDQAPVTDRTRLLSDNGPGYVSRAFRDYLGMVGIRHILAAPFHPQTNGKLERYHQTLKRDMNQLPYELPSDLEAAIVAFVSYYNYRRYHKALGNVTPSDVLRGRREEILRRRREVKAQTIERRRQHNKALRELTRPPTDL